MSHISTWEDLGLRREAFTSRDFWALDSFTQMYRATRQDIGGIVYFTMIHYWVDLFGTRIFVYRLFSAFCSVLGVLALYVLAHELSKSHRVAFLSALLLCFHPMDIDSAQFTRSHALTCLFTICSTYYFSKLVQQSGAIRAAHVVLYSATSVAAMLCHYFAIYVIVGHVLYMLFFERRPAVWRAFVLSASASVASFSVWMWLGGLEVLRTMAVVNRIFRARVDQWGAGVGPYYSNPYYIPFGPYSVAGGTAQVLLASSGNWVQDLGVRIRWLVVPGALFWGATLYGAYLLRNRLHETFRLPMLTILAYFVWATLVGWRSHLMFQFLPHYAKYIVPYVCIVVAWVLCGLFDANKKKLGYFLIALQSPFWLLSLYSVYLPSESLRDGTYYEKKAEQVVTDWKANRAIVVNHPNWEDAFFVNLHLKEWPDIRQKLSNEEVRDPLR